MVPQTTNRQYRAQIIDRILSQRKKPFCSRSKELQQKDCVEAITPEVLKSSYLKTFSLGKNTIFKFGGIIRLFSDERKATMSISEERILYGLETEEDFIQYWETCAKVHKVWELTEDEKKNIEMFLRNQRVAESRKYAA